MYLVVLIGSLVAIASLATAAEKPKVENGQKLISMVGNHFMDAFAKAKAAGFVADANSKKSNLRAAPTNKVKRQDDEAEFLTITAYQGPHCGVPLEQFTLQLYTCVPLSGGLYFAFAAGDTLTDNVQVFANVYSDSACSNENYLGSLPFLKAYPTKCGEDVYYYGDDGIILDGETYFKAERSSSAPAVPSKPGIQQEFFVDSYCSDAKLFLRDWVHKSHCINTGDGYYQRLLCNDVQYESRVRFYAFSNEGCTGESYHARSSQFSCYPATVEPPTTTVEDIQIYAYMSMTCVNLPHKKEG